MSLSDHAGTHVDAPCHFNPDPDAASIDEMPLEDFYTSAICLDLCHVPLKHEITVAEMEAALAASGERSQARHRADRHGREQAAVRIAGLCDRLSRAACRGVHWLADKGVVMFGVEAVSPAPEGEPNFKAHIACAERGITHIECLWNLEKVVGKGRFTFIGFPLHIRGGTASPIRAVAMFDDRGECGD